MKYGKTLRQRSVPAWNCYNIEYDKIKYFIKDQTTPGNGKAVAIPGRGEIDKAVEFEDKLYRILSDSYANITLFVKSKSGEIRSRLAQNERQLTKLATRPKAFKSNRIPLSELQAYACIEKDVVRAGQDIECLSRFISAQRTAFRKLLKKYRKWTGSTTLQERFEKGVFDDPKGFNKFDAGPLLDTYSALLHTIRMQYGKLIGSPSTPRPDTPLDTIAEGSAAVREIRDALDREQKSAFDACMETVRLGQGEFASYFVHPDNVMELEVFLMQYTRYYLSRSRNNSMASQIHDTTTKLTSFTPIEPDVSDYHAIAADKVDRFVKANNESRPGTPPQRSKTVIRWSEGPAMASLRTGNRIISACINQKTIMHFLNENEEFHALEDAQGGMEMEKARREMLQEGVHPLFHYASCRSRFLGLDNGEAGVLMATLDTSIRIDQATSLTVDTKRAAKFPFAILTLRQEGFAAAHLRSILDESHLVERVPGFSVEYHCVWEAMKPESMPAPSWIPTLSRDIRKIPKDSPTWPRPSTRNTSGENTPNPPMVKRPSPKERSGSSSGLNSGMASHRATMSPKDSTDGTADSGTVVEHSSAESHLSALENPPLRSFRKKKRPVYPPALIERIEEPKAQKQRYWNEYDNPEDGEDEGTYAIYVDPYEASPLERAIDNFFSKLGNLFRKQWPEEEQPLMPSTPADEESSEDEEVGEATNFGTFPRSASAAQSAARENRSNFVSQLAGASLVVSTAFLVVGYILSATGKHKLYTEVRVGVILCIVCSLAAALMGFRNVVKAGSLASYRLWWFSFAVLLIDAVIAGGLIAAMFG